MSETTWQHVSAMFQTACVCALFAYGAYLAWREEPKK